MCGRFQLTAPARVIAEAFAVAVPEEPDLAARYNIAPGQRIAAVRARVEGGGRELALLRWGLVPAWSKEMPREAKLINARCETASEKPSFRSAFRSRRCLVPATGFYEWQAAAAGSAKDLGASATRLEGRARGLRGVKQPYLVGLRDGAPFAIAALWERWTPPRGEPLESCTLLTTEANPLMRPIHDRMPVILGPANWDAWLDPRLHDAQRLRAMLAPYPDAELSVCPVSPWVNDPRHDDQRCAAPTCQPGARLPTSRA